MPNWKIVTASMVGKQLGDLGKVQRIDVGKKFYTDPANGSLRSNRTMVFIESGEQMAKRTKPKQNGRVRVIRNTEGFKDARGQFHPIRGGDEYDPESAGEHGKDEYGYAKRKRTGAKVKRASSKARKNPGTTFPVGKFVKVDKVRVNRNGTIDVMRSRGGKLPARRPKR